MSAEAVWATVTGNGEGTKESMNLIHSIATRAWNAGFKVITARCERCQRSMTLSRFSAHKAGIKMGGHWYCGSACFASAAEEELSELVSSVQDRVPRVERMPLELTLVSRGWLSGTELKEIRDEQKEEGGEIGELLVRRGSVSERQLTAARATQWGCPIFAVSKRGIPAKIHIPSTLMQLYSMIPLHYAAATNLLLVGFVYNVEYGLLYAIEKVTGCKTQPCFVTPSDFQLQMHWREQAKKKSEDAIPSEVQFDCVQTPTEMARILCNYGVHIEADEAVIGKCKEYFWARLKSGSKDLDLLFKAE